MSHIGRSFLRSNYVNIAQYTCTKSLTATETMAINNLKSENLYKLLITKFIIKL